MSLPEVSCSHSRTLGDLTFSTVILDPACHHLLLLLSLGIQSRSHPSVTSTTLWMGYCYRSLTDGEKKPKSTLSSNSAPSLGYIPWLIVAQPREQHSAQTSHQQNHFHWKSLLCSATFSATWEKSPHAILAIRPASFCIRPPLQDLFLLKNPADVGYNFVPFLISLFQSIWSPGVLLKH